MKPQARTPRMKSTGALALAALMSLGTLAALPSVAQARDGERVAERRDARMERRQTLAEKGVTRDVTRSDGDVKATISGPNGNEVTRSTERENGDKTTTLTGSEGTSVSRSVDRDAEGRTISTTNAAGETRTRSVDRSDRRDLIQQRRQGAGR